MVGLSVVLLAFSMPSCQVENGWHKIDSIYINEAIRIRTKYLNSLNNILKEEKSIEEKRLEIENIKNNMESIVNNDMNDITKRLKLNMNLNEIEKLVNQIQIKINLVTIIIK